jgi:ADP-dependent phosphofructokinase/glucokinase
MLGLMPPDVLLAQDGGLVRAGVARRRGGARLPVFIFEYTAGQPVGDVVPQRSSRIIVRFGNFSLEDDPDFAQVTAARAASAGAGLMSGFSSVAAADMPAETGRAVALVRAWRAAGLQTVHLELAGFETLELMHAVLRAARGAATSVGMSLSELQAIEGDGREVADAMCALGDRLGLDRVCVHADHWAASVTRRDPDRESDALITGCLLAGARAMAGRPMRPARLDGAVTFEKLPFPPLREAGAWNFVACASPYLLAPATTLGLGDTFTGGCLLTLGAGP